MKKYRADLHLHSVLSPCGDLEMSPINLVEQAKLRGLEIIGITDHNSTKHSALVKELALREGIFCLCGAEVTSKEEAHLLCFMPDEATLQELQDYLDFHLIKVPNNTKYFGEQLVVSEQEEILSEEPFLLINAIDQDVNQISHFVMERGGIFIPAHINRSAFSLASQLGFVPPDLYFHALEISRYISLKEFLAENPYLSKSSFIQSSDAHFPVDVGSVFTNFYLENPNFEEIKMALQNKEGRYCEIPE